MGHVFDVKTIYVCMYENEYLPTLAHTKIWLSQLLP